MKALLSQAGHARQAAAGRASGGGPQSPATTVIVAAPAGTPVNLRDGHTDAEIRRFLSYRRVAVVGMSRDPSKDAHAVPLYLINHGYDVVPVNPSAAEILGRRCYPSASSVEGPIDILEVFRPSGLVPPVVLDALPRRPRVVWLQEGIHNEEAEDAAERAGADVVFNRCMLAEHRRLAAQ